MNKRQIPGWSVLAAALIVAIAAATAISNLRQEADKILQAERLLIHLEAQAYRLSSLEYHAISEQKLELETVKSVQAVRSRLQETLDRVFLLVPSGQSLQQVTKSYREYITAVDEEFLLIKAGRFDQARTLDKQRVNPSFEVLSKEIADANATYRDMAHWTLQKADIGSALTLISAAAAIGLLFWQFKSAQRNAQIQLVRTEQRVLLQSEERFRSLVQNASDAILILEMDSTIYYASASVYRILNYHPEDWVGTNVLNWVHPDNAPQIQKFFSECLHNLEITPTIELQFQHSKGHWCYVEALGNNRLSDPSVNGIVINFREITERKRAEQELKIYAAKLVQSNCELEDFARVASHDLQEPLRKIQAFGVRLKAKCGEELSDQGRDYLARMQQAASRMQTLIDDLLSFSRFTIEAQPFVLVNLTLVAQEVVADLEVRIEQTGGCVEVGDLPTIEAEPTQMRQLLQNILSNALKFHHNDRAPVVKLYSQCQDSQQNRVTYSSGEQLCQIVVEDNGIGFDEKYFDRIFTIFQRLHGRTEYAGSGVGLAVCRKIAERHGGSITAKSIPGQGATFMITLPVKQPQRENVNKYQEPIAILLADDADERMLAKETLLESRLANSLYLVEDGE